MREIPISCTGCFSLTLSISITQIVSTCHHIITMYETLHRKQIIMYHQKLHMLGLLVNHYNFCYLLSWCVWWNRVIYIHTHTRSCEERELQRSYNHRQSHSRSVTSFRCYWPGSWPVLRTLQDAWVQTLHHSDSGKVFLITMHLILACTVDGSSGSSGAYA